MADIEPFEFEDNGVSYKARRMGAIPQAYVMKRLGAVFDDLFTFVQNKRQGNMSLVVLKSLGSLKDDDLLFVFNHCLGLVERKRDDKWEKIWNPQAGQPQHGDINLSIMMGVTLQVILVTFGPFLAELFALGPAEPLESTSPL